MSVQIWDETCDCCGHYRELEPEQYAYQEALEHLIDAARDVGRSEVDVWTDLREWWRWHKVADAAKLDKDVVRLWWVDAASRATVGGS